MVTRTSGRVPPDSTPGSTAQCQLGLLNKLGPWLDSCHLSLGSWKPSHRKGAFQFGSKGANISSFPGPENITLPVKSM